MRSGGRDIGQPRALTLEAGFTENPQGSVLARLGRTMVLCTASVSPGVPRHREDKGGWLTAEYAMIPGSTDRRSQREGPGSKGKGRSREIERLIGRSLRAAVDLDALGEVTINIDAEVLQADGGTRTCSILGGFVALVHAIGWYLDSEGVKTSPLLRPIGAISVGWTGDKALVDLDQVEDNGVEVDLNVVFTGGEQLVEVQGTAEGAPFSKQALDEMVSAALAAAPGLFEAQRAACAGYEHLVPGWT